MIDMNLQPLTRHCWLIKKRKNRMIIPEGTNRKTFLHSWLSEKLIQDGCNAKFNNISDTLIDICTNNSVFMFRLKRRTCTFVDKCIKWNSEIQGISLKFVCIMCNVSINRKMWYPLSYQNSSFSAVLLLY